MQKLSLGIAGIFFSSQAFAIVNIESMRSDDETPGFKLQASFNVNGKNGNSQKTNLETGLLFRWNQQTSRQMLIMTYEYGETSDVKDTQNSFAHLRHIQDINSRLAWEVFTQMESDEFKRLSLRALLGAGVRINLVDQGASYKSWLGLGAFRSREELEEDPGITEDLTEYATRANIYHGFRYPLSETSRLFNTIYYQPVIGDAGDYRILEQFGISVDVTRDLSLKVSLDVKHDNEPPISVKQTDTSYNTGFEYRF
ncbi:MAG: DUF481 domain-containing protein [Gammaproteobacteria bacterium]|nr:MAG: DUF481 domain-containing protein [Gammaproteobacteria bacterium]